jgi:hypothetical protein
MKRKFQIKKVIVPTIILLLLLFSTVFTINASAFSGPDPQNSQYSEIPAAFAPNALYLNVVGEAYWPPFIGDLVGASFMLENITGQDKTYDEVGVYGTKDGSTILLLTNSGPVTIEAGGSWTFNGHFPGGFGAGTYLLTIYVVDGSGFQTIGGYEYFVVDSTPPPDETPEPTETSTPEETETPARGNPNNGNGNGGVGNPDKCEDIDTVGDFIKCKLLPPLRGFTCWIIQMFNPNSMCKIKP